MSHHPTFWITPIILLIMVLLLVWVGVLDRRKARRWKAATASNSGASADTVGGSNAQ